MALTVSSSLNQKTWDATVRVTGGHPNQLWGIGAVQQSAEGKSLEVDRALIRDADERMVGYAQLLIRHERGGTHVEGHHVHVNRSAAVPAFMQTLAGYVRDRYGAYSMTLSVDTPGIEPLNEALAQRGWVRQETVTAHAVGPRRLRVSLGSTAGALSSRLSADTLDRCRAGLKVSDVAVREITANPEGIQADGLKTAQINHLLKDLGQDSLLLVAAQERPGQQPETLGYLWFVHTVGLAMLYRVGFTRKARELGIDDALLLTGAVELQKRGVQRMDGGDSSDQDIPTVVRELADHERTVLGTWRKELVEPMEPAAVDAQPKKRGLFGRKKKDADYSVVDTQQQEQGQPARVDEVKQQVSAGLGIQTTGMIPIQPKLTDQHSHPNYGSAPQLSESVQEAAEAVAHEQSKDPKDIAAGHMAGMQGQSRSYDDPTPWQQDPAGDAPTATVDENSTGPDQQKHKPRGKFMTFARRIFSEGMHAFKDAAGR